MGGCTCKQSSSLAEKSIEIKVQNNEYEILDSNQIQNKETMKFTQEQSAIMIQTNFRGIKAKKVYQQEKESYQMHFPQNAVQVKSIPLPPLPFCIYQSKSEYKKLPPLQIGNDIYDGEWNYGQKQGFGVLWRSDGAIQIGQWDKDQFKEGGILYGNGDYSVNGQYHYSNGTKIRTKEIIYNDGTRYTGQTECQKKHGRGRLVFSDGAIYDGQFKNDEIEGKGEFRWPNGRRYVGEWFKNRMHGKGILFFEDGRIYEGEFFNNKRHGEGTMKLKDGRKFKGQFKNNCKDGQGILIDGKEQTQGQWREGKKVG